jgi:hypothetical protein
MIFFSKLNFTQMSRGLRVLCIRLSYFALVIMVETTTMFIIIGVAAVLMILAIFSCKPSGKTHYLHYYEE